MISTIEIDNLIIKAVSFAAILVLVWVLCRFVRRLFNKIRERQSGIYLVFFERVVTAVIIVGGLILAFSVFGGGRSVWRTLLGGTAFLSAVLAFAAQDVIKDSVDGMMISIYKPFEIGDRIVLEDGTAGIVKDITMRHVVLQLMDTQVLVIPNSRLNEMKIRNFSWHSPFRSAHFDFHIAYDSDAKKAIEVVRNAVISSPYSVAGKRTDKGMDYAPVYFMAFEDSSLKLSTTVYYRPSTATEVLISDVNLRVSEALEKNGIEIPYPFVNIVQRK